MKKLIFHVYFELLVKNIGLWGDNISVGDPVKFGPDPDPTSDDRPDPVQIGSCLEFVSAN
jgi:hypothetical protein